MRKAALVLCVLSTSVLPAGTVGFEETFALSPDRKKALEELIPGTEEYYFYHCLYYQSLGDFAAVQKLLKAYLKRYGRTPRVTEIEHRQALLRYSTDPEGTCAYLTRVLGLSFTHTRQVPGAKPALPTSLRPELISREAFTSRALSRHSRTMDGFEDHALPYAAGLRLDPDRRHHLLSRLRRPDVPGLVELLCADLREKRNRPFGSLRIHSLLTLRQLRQCLKLMPNLLNQDAFVRAYLTKLRPNPDADWRNDPARRQAYLERLWAFVSRLNPSHNSLRAHVLYHRLAHDRSLGVYNRSRFLTYLKLPRRAHYMRKEYLNLPEHSRWPADLNADFSPVTGLRPVRNDEPLLRDYLEHFLLEADTTAPFDTYLNETYLKHLFAEIKIVNGRGDMERWYSLLPPQLYTQLKERVDLDFAPTNRTTVGPTEQVALDLYVKHVKTLIVKIYVINTLSYLRAQHKEVDTSIDLDGLVPNFQRTYTYSEPPLRRVKRHFEFPELTSRGVYVIDFIGNGKSSRALVRKGSLSLVSRTSVAGHVITVLDEAGRPLKDASLYLGGKHYTASEDGTIVVPFSTKPGTKTVVLSHKGFACLGTLQHEAERYRLTGGIHLEREELLPGHTASVVVRPALRINGYPAPLALLKKVKVVIETVDLAGIKARKEISDVALSEEKELLCSFVVPPRLSQVTVTVSGTVKNLSKEKEEKLSFRRAFSLNQIDKTEKVEDLFLTVSEQNYVLTVRGKNGEVKPDRAVTLTFKHRLFRDPFSVSLKTDRQGRIFLGPLREIQYVKARGPEGTEHTWTLTSWQYRYPASLHAQQGEQLRLPSAAEKLTQEDFSLLEVRAGTYVRDCFASLALRQGFVVLDDLARGDYELRLPDCPQPISIRIIAGTRLGPYLLGSYRRVWGPKEKPLQIQRVELTEKDLAITVANAHPATRLHVAACRYLPAFSLFGDLLPPPPPAGWAMTVPAAQSQYVVGRDIGDEYRYILERKLAKTFPGNMLPRPSLLLNPWAVRSTETARQEARAGGRFRARGRPRPPARREAERAEREGRAAPAGSFWNLDFLPEPAALLLNLKVSPEGTVRIPRAKLGNHPLLYILAAKPGSTVMKRVPLPEKPFTPRDRRLKEGLDPDRHWAQVSQVTVVRAGEAFRVENAQAAQIQIYDSLPEVFDLLRVLCPDPTLGEFSFISRWPQLSEEEKQKLYSTYACHELTFFLYCKDRPFFEKVIRPYLANKFQKTFLDRYLLNTPLTQYLKVWSHSRLNLVEKILLGRRQKEDYPFMVKEVEDLFEVTPRDTSYLNRLFETALRGRILQEKPAETAAVEEAEAIRLGRPAARPAPGAAAAVTRRFAEKTQRAALKGAPKLRSLGEKAKDRLALAARDLERRKQLRRLYRVLEKTKEWAENNWYHLPLERESPSMIPVNAFWRDYARSKPGQPFLSPHIAEASRSFTEVMLALAVCDLPFQGKKHTRAVKGNTLTITAKSPMLVYHKQIRPASPSPQAMPILVSQNFYRFGERYTRKAGKKVDNFTRGPFVVHTPYGCQVVVTNPTSSPRKLQLLLQIPQGAVPLKGSKKTHSLTVELQPYRTWTTDYYFYFPAPGTFTHFPVHVACEGKVAGFAKPQSFPVLAKPPQEDRTSWRAISQNGTAGEVLSFLAEANLKEIDLGLIAWRMRDRDFFLKAVELLSRRHAYHHTLWSYGITHNVPEAIRQFLRHADSFVNACGPVLSSPLLVLDPVERKAYQHLEYEPLVNARAHRLGPKRRILNNRFFAQYQKLMKILCYVPHLSDDDLMSVTYYMILQDRIEEALEFFRKVKPRNLSSPLQYDYFAAYLALSEEKLRLARRIATRYLTYPVPKWRERFETVMAHLAEIEGARSAALPEKPQREKVHEALAATEPSFDVKLQGNRIAVTYQNLTALTVNYYLMDLELLFSRNPFVSSYGKQFAAVMPNHSTTVRLPQGKRTFSFEVPEKFKSTNVLIEVRAAGQSRQLPFFANELSLQIIENYAQLRVTHARTGKPVAKAYVKVYARMKGGRVRFYKDGYTDLRGRFDYGSLSTNDMDYVERFALLVISQQAGSVIREAAPPPR